MNSALQSDSRVLIRNVRIFDGVSPSLTHGDVLVHRQRIEAVSSSPIAIESEHTATVIDGANRVLIPGLIDVHVHLVGNANTYPELVSGTEGQLAINALAEAGRMLQRGFTTVRDMAGDTASLTGALDSGLFPGPRIFPSQAAISQTSGHGDFSYPYEAATALGGRPSRAEEISFMRVADGPDRVTAAVREQLKRGATQIKLMAGGGAASVYDPLSTLQFTPAELTAAVAAAADYGTYVATHVYTVAGIRRAVAAGVRSIEHGQLADEATIALLAESEVWLSMQPFAEADHHYPDPDRQQKNRDICDGVTPVYEWAKKHGVRVAFGTDLLLEPQLAARQSTMAARLTEFYSPAEALRMLTSDNAELVALAGERNPYRKAALGQVKEGAWADLVLVDGNPLEDFSLIGQPEEAFVVIIKDGQIHKNAL